jgi:hypothetical protein
MKHTIVSTLVCVLISTPFLVYAEEPVPRHEVFAAAQAMLDMTTAAPGVFLPIEKDMRAYRIAKQQYEIETEKALAAAFDIGTREAKVPNDFAKFAAEFDAHSKQISQLFNQRKEIVKRMQSTAAGKRLWSSIIEVRPEYNDALVAPYDTKYHEAVLALLAQSRDTYRALSVQSTAFAFANGQFFFTTPEQSYTYLRHLTHIRAKAREVLIAHKNKSQFLLKQPNLQNLYGNEYMAQLDTSIKDKDALLANWSRTTALPASPVYAPLTFFLRVSTAIPTDAKVIVAREQLNHARSQYTIKHAFQKSDFTSAGGVQAVSTNLQNILTPLAAYERAVNDVGIKMNKEISEQYNIHRAIYAASDAELAAHADPLILTYYTHGLLEYQKAVYAAVMPCLAKKGKAKCTVKITDDITVKVSDVKTQKALDALKATFLKTYAFEYGQWKGKQLP